MALPVLATLLSAGLYAASFPPLALSPLIWIALVPFFAACSRVRPLAGAGLGVLWGVFACWGVSYWLPGMLAEFFQTGRLTAWAAYLAVALGLAGPYYGGFGAWLAFGARGKDDDLRRRLVQRRDALLGELARLEERRQRETLDAKSSARRQRVLGELEQIYGELDGAHTGPRGGGEGIAA